MPRKNPPKRTRNRRSATTPSSWWPSGSPPRNGSPSTASTSLSWRISRITGTTGRAGRTPSVTISRWTSASSKCRATMTTRERGIIGCWTPRATTWSSASRAGNSDGAPRPRPRCAIDCAAIGDRCWPATTTACNAAGHHHGGPPPPPPPPTYQPLSPYHHGGRPSPFYPSGGQGWSSMAGSRFGSGGMEQVTAAAAAAAAML